MPSIRRLQKLALCACQLDIQIQSLGVEGCSLILQRRNHSDQCIETVAKEEVGSLAKSAFAREFRCNSQDTGTFVSNECTDEMRDISV